MDGSGALLFARYAYPPNALGYCGPDDSSALLEHVAAGTADAELAHLARAFDGAWPYLEVLAAANGIDDPLDHRVVEAYWVGNRLLDAVPAAALGRSLDDRFRRRAGRTWGRLAEIVPAGARPHHGVHVLCVYPWVGLLRSGSVEAPLHVLDRCRIRWGRVVDVDGDRAVVHSQPLAWDGRTLWLGPARHEVAIHADGGRSLAPAIRPGDLVSLHWSWICDVLSPAAVAALRRCTADQLDLVNRRVTHPGPAAVLG